MKVLLIGDTNIQDREDPASAFSKVRDLLDASDIRFCHAEGMFTETAREKGIPSLVFKERWRHSTPEMFTAFRDARFDALCMASNVSAESAAVSETIHIAEGYGIKVCGIGENVELARSPAVVEREGVKFALLSRTCVFWPNIVPATETRAGAATVRAYTAYQPGRRSLEMPGSPPEIRTWPDEAELARLIEDIEAARTVADCVILSLHWGISGSQEVLDYQRCIGRAAVDAGVSLVFGHHSHMVAPVEVYRGVPIFYSLGNFAFDWEKARNRILDGIAVEARWDRESKRFSECTIIPVSRGEDNLIAPVPEGSPTAERILGFVQETAECGSLSRIFRKGDRLGIVLNRPEAPF